MSTFASSIRESSWSTRRSAAANCGGGSATGRTRGELLEFRNAGRRCPHRWLGHRLELRFGKSGGDEKSSHGEIETVGLNEASAAEITQDGIEAYFSQALESHQQVFGRPKAGFSQFKQSSQEMMPVAIRCVCVHGSRFAQY